MYVEHWHVEPCHAHLRSSIASMKVTLAVLVTVPSISVAETTERVYIVMLKSHPLEIPLNNDRLVGNLFYFSNGSPRHLLSFAL